MTSPDANNLARVHELHRQYFGDSSASDSASRPQSSHTPIIPPVDDDDDDQIVFTNPFPNRHHHSNTNNNNNNINNINIVPTTAAPLAPLWRYEDPTGIPYLQACEPMAPPPPGSGFDTRRRRAPTSDLFRPIDWNSDRSASESRERESTLKRAPSAGSSASGSSKVKAQKENGIFRKTSQRYGKFSRAIKDYSLASKSRRLSGSDTMEGVEVSATALEPAMSSAAAGSAQSKAPHRFYRQKFITSLKAPRHDTPQPVNADGVPRSSPVAPSSSAVPHYLPQRYFTAPQFAHDTSGGDAARRAAAAASNASRYSQYSPPMPAYQLRRDSYRKSISTLPIASDSGADLVGNVDIDMLDAEKAAVEAKVDPVAALPTEIVTLVFSHLDAPTLKACRKVNNTWASLAVDPLIWRGQYLQQFQKQVFVDPAPIQIGGTGSGRPNKPIQNWELMYDARTKINQNWARGDQGGKAVYLSGHTDSVYCVQFDEHKIITGSRDRTIRVWDINTLQCIKVIGGPTVRPTPGPKSLRTVDASKVYRTVPSVNGTRYGDSIYHIPSDFHSASILCLQYDDEILVTGSSDNDLLVWDIKTFEPIRRLRHHGGGVLDVAFDSKHIVSCSKDCTIVVWDRKTLQPIRSLNGHRGPVNAVQLRGNLLVSASGDGVARLWDLNKMECVREFPPKERGLAAVEFSDDAKYVLAGGNDHTTYKFDVATGAEVKTFTGHTQLVRSLFLDTQNRRVVSGSYDLDLRVYDYDTGDLLGRFNEWTTSWMLAAKSDYRRIVSTSQDGRILMIDFGLDQNGNPIRGVEHLASS